MKKQTSSVNLVLVGITLVSFIIASMSGFAYMASKSNFKSQLANQKNSYQQKSKNNNIALIAKQNEIDQLKRRISVDNNQKDSTTTATINENAATTIDHFVRTILGGQSAATMRKTLKPLATDDVIQKVAPENVNEKYDNQNQNAKISFQNIQIYQALNSDSQQPQYYVVANYQADKTILKTRMVIELTQQANKALISRATYDMQNTANGGDSSAN